MLISVIIPVYNSAAFLRECVGSVLNQDENLEIILINDGSKDDSGAICDKLAKENANIKVLHKQNGGVSSARNAGLELAKGDYIAFIDSDDSIKKGYFTDLLAKIGSSDALVLSINDYKVPKPFILSGSQAIEFMLKDKAHRFGWAPWNKLFKRSIIGDLRFNESEHVTEDFSFISKIFLGDIKVAFDTGGLYNYQDSDTSIMRSSYNAKYDSMVLVGDNFLKECKERAPSLVPLAFFALAQGTLFLIYKAREAGLYEKVASFSTRLRANIFPIIFNKHGSVKFKLVILAHAFCQKILLARYHKRAKNEATFCHN
ncbi:MAG: glycosyltransferase family 2 protein [Campylobacteraceae bacterium]|nr:glycosyltransferase family 2 protein [Campylobacteraceae bacterium]MDY4121633.1 glycosyltransferase family 2 protein [Campylobacter sp.]